MKSIIQKNLQVKITKPLRGVEAKSGDKPKDEDRNVPYKKIKQYGYTKMGKTNKDQAFMLTKVTNMSYEIMHQRPIINRILVDLFGF